jgi:hypothetical protein
MPGKPLSMRLQGIFFLGLFLHSGLNVNAQQLEFFILDPYGAHNKYYLELGKTYEFQLDACFEDGHYEDELPFSMSAGFKISTKDKKTYSVTPTRTGEVFLSASAEINGKVISFDQLFMIVDLPKPEISISVISPDSRFMWLEITDKETGKPIDLSAYDLWMLDYRVYDKKRNIKTSDVYIEKGWYFPSLTITEPNVYFALKDRLEVGLSLIHKKYGLPIYSTLKVKIKELWH